jgi:hypothetical protein
MGTFSDMAILVIIAAVKIALVLLILLTGIAYATWLERKVVAHMQARWGPYLVGPHGLLQPVADGIKFILKEDIMPLEADKIIYWLAPFLGFVLAFLSIAVIPFGEGFTLYGHSIQFQITDLNVGLLFVFAVTSLGVYSIALAGWSSNSKYPLLRRAAVVRADDQLRAFAGTGGDRHADDGRHAQPAWHRRRAKRFHVAYPRNQYLDAALVYLCPAHRLFRLLHSRRLRKPIAYRLTCPKVKRSWWADSIPNTAA